MSRDRFTWREPSPLNYALMFGGVIFILALAMFVLLLMPISYGRAAERPAPGSEWFNGLRQPDTGASCCDISDCKRTAARWVGDEKGHWEARVPLDGSPVTDATPFQEIPRSKELKDKQSPDGEAYVCNGHAGSVYCFVPPSMGY